MKRRDTLTFLATGIVAACGRRRRSKVRGEELFPIDAGLTAFGDLRPYFAAVRDLLAGPACTSIILVLPSFHAEWSVRVVYDRGTPLVLFAEVKEQFWVHRRNGFSIEGIPVTRAAAALAPGVAVAVEGALASAVEMAEQPSEPRRILDGTDYLCFGPRARDGCMARTPEDGTVGRRVADIADGLRAIALSINATRELELQLERTAKAVAF